MGNLATLLSFFDRYEDAHEALRQVRRSGYHRVALIHKSQEGRIRVRGTTRRRWTTFGVVLGIIAGGFLSSFSILVGSFSISLPLLLPLVLATLLMGILGWLLVRRLAPGVEDDLIDKLARWLVADESLVLLRAVPEALAWAIPILRSIREAQPSIFTLDICGEVEDEEEILETVPLSTTQIQERARRLASDHKIGATAVDRNGALLRRLDQSEHVIQQVCDDLAGYGRLEQSISPSAEWLLDNTYIVQSHIRDVRLNLPERFYEELPVLSDGRLKGEPRIYALATDLIIHTDGHLDRNNISDFLEAYQSISALNIGELWALPLMLRIAIAERLRRLALQVLRRFHEGVLADFWANRLLTTARRDANQLFSVLAELAQERPKPSPFFSSQLTGHLYDEQAALVPARSWLERSLQGDLGEIHLQEQTRQAAIQISIGNAITSLRQLSLLDWREIFEDHSHIDEILRHDPARVYESMDFATRDQYRRAIEEIARGAKTSEGRVATLAVDMASEWADDRSADPRHSHVGYHLIDGGRPQLVRRIGGKETGRHRVLQWVYRNHTVLYLGAIACMTVLLVGGALGMSALTGERAPLLKLGLLLVLMPASQLAIQMVNYIVTRLLPPRTLPKMSFEEHGIPDFFRTMVVVPMLLVDEPTIQDEIEKLEIRYLANPHLNLLFSLFSDYTDSEEKVKADDEMLLDLAVQGIENLNRRYGANRFYLFHREREWSESEGLYIGWERKRGKLEELNRLIDGEPQRGDQEIVRVGDASQLTNIRFVITLDSDTQLPRDSARRMIETLAHPLNLPTFDEEGKPRRGSYTIIQPRVSTALPSATATPFSRLCTDPVGVDPYTRAVSDAYQDLSGEGSYLGKGIYDPRAFNRLSSGRFPEQRILSHDLLEGAHVRVSYASDIELYDDFPADYLTYARRQHRWIRGDWQIADWILPRVPVANGDRVPNPLSILNRWKIFDNLRRSLVPISIMLFLLLAWVLSPTFGTVASVLTGILLLFQPLLHPVTWATSPLGFGKFSLDEVMHGVARSIVEASLIPYQAGLAVDAIIRVWYRRLFSKRNFLEWTTAQMSEWQTAGQVNSFLLTISLVSLFSLGVGYALWLLQPNSLFVAVPYLLLWFISPIIVWKFVRGTAPSPQSMRLSNKQTHTLRQLARRTWRYFDDFVGPETHWLPPDNYQVSHQDQLAFRTSPTNIGLWMLSALGAYDFGYLSGDQVLERVSQTMQTLKGLEQYEGHLLNWYDIKTLTPLEPRYVSMVDSGNLLGSLSTLESGIEEILDEAILKPNALNGIHDTLEVLREVLRASERLGSHLKGVERISSMLTDPPERLDRLVQRLRQISGPIVAMSYNMRQSAGSEYEAVYWAGKLEAQISQWILVIDRYLRWVEVLASEPEETWSPLGEKAINARKRALNRAPSLRSLASREVPEVEIILGAAGQHESLPPPLKVWLDALGEAFSEACWFAGEVLAQGERLIQSGREFADSVNMRFLYDAERRLFTIGYNVSNQSHDGSYYDLLASEARLGSFIAIARGEVPNEHWLALSRPFGSAGRRRVLLSWTGTMFEYLMPLLLQRTFANSLLDKATQEAVALQRSYGDQRRVPWGISESAYGDLDINKTYQYKAFGVPGLGLKRGLDEDLVVAPYASLLALMVEPIPAVKNLDRLAKEGLRGRYGFFEAIDFSRQRKREGERGVIVRAYMAHHQAMGFLAIVNLLFDQSMQRRFHKDARVKATEPLLYERVPVSPPLFHISTREQPPPREAVVEIAPSVSTFDTPHTNTPRTQLLSNGTYGVMITNAGGGYSQWGDFEITRWRADMTRDPWGSFCYIRDLHSGVVWSNTYLPIGGEVEGYEVDFAIDRAEFRRRDGAIVTETEIIVSPEDDAEIRRLTLINRSNRVRHLEITSYVELAMAPHETDRQHPAFNKLFIQTEWIPQHQALLAFRRARDEEDTPIFVAYRMTMEGHDGSKTQFETDRMRFIGRGRTLNNPVALEGELSNSEGYVLDPIFSLRKILTLKPRQRVSFNLVTAAAGTRGEVLALIEKYGEPRAIGRSLELAWVRAQLELRLLRIQPDDARRFQALAKHLLYPNARLRPPVERLEQNTLGQSRLWPYGISGDLPIAVVSIGESRDISLVRQVLQAHTYWRQHGLKSDLVILNEESSSYEQPLNERLSRLIETYSIYTGVDQPGGVYLRSVDQIPEADLTLILCAARIGLVAARGPLSQQLSARRVTLELPEEIPLRKIPEEPSAPLPFMELPYFNDLGGFTTNGREYAIYLSPDTNTPAPWVNVMANPSFGALVSESGSGFVWYGNSQQYRLTGWSNDPVSDPASEAIYIRDEDSGTFWTPTPLPIRELDAYRARHGAGYSVFEHNSHAIEQELVTFVPMDNDGGEPLRIQRLRLRNDSTRPRRLSVTFYAEWVLGDDRENSQMHVVTKWDQEAKALLAYNRYHPDYGERIAFASISPAPEDYTADRAVFIGRNRSLESPAALRRVHLSRRTGAALDPCAAMRVELSLEPGQSGEVTVLLGSVASRDEAVRIIQKYRESLRVEEALQRTSGWWDRILGRVQVEHPELSTEFLLNRWLLYQSLSCRIWGRSAFYQSGGAFGFRDQLQDVLALLLAAPDLVRGHILRTASRQFVEGDVQHWWHPPSGAGVRTRISDDLLWLPYVVSHYVRVTGDRSILEETIPFLESRPLEEGEHEIFLVPDQSSERASLYEHCRRAIQRGLTSGPHGLPLIGIGDWNDGMNRVGVDGKGESVWLAWFLIDVLNGFAEVAQGIEERDDADQFRQQALQLAATVEREAWDGEWYLRAIFDDGTPLGSSKNEEARIASLPQSWAWISGAADSDRAEQALKSAWEHLVREDEKLVLLFTPPFDTSELTPGYIKGYPPGVRENGGQYTHGALWLAIAYARKGDGERAAHLLRLMNPVEHTREPEDVQRYAVEPYVVAADVYRLPGREGRGGWTWYTGSAGWMYRAWIEEVLGLKVRDGNLTLDPVIPQAWEGFRLRYCHGEAVYEIEVENPDGVNRGVAWVEMDGRRLEEVVIPLEEAAIKHRVRVRMGRARILESPKDIESEQLATD